MRILRSEGREHRFPVRDWDRPVSLPSVLVRDLTAAVLLCGAEGAGALVRDTDSGPRPG